MSEIVEREAAVLIGKKKLEKNDFFQDLCVLLEDEKFKQFFDKYMSSWMYIKCSITYMHLYRQFKIKYKELNNEELDKNLAIYLLKKIMCDKTLRPWSITTVDKMLNNKKMDFFEEFESLMIANK